MHPAALPQDMEQLGERNLEALVNVADHKLHTTQAMLPELAASCTVSGCGVTGRA
jgi:hypothetical protein